MLICLGTPVDFRTKLELQKTKAVKALFKTGKFPAQNKREKDRVRPIGRRY